MRKPKPIIVIVALIGFVSAVTWQYVSNDSLRRDNEGLKQVVGELKRLSDVTAPAAIADTFTEEQQAELLKLRAEVTQLRTQTNQVEVLAEANQKLRASLREVRASQPTVSSSKKRPEDALPQDIHPRASWAFRGYATPEATMESVLSAMLNGDKAAVREGVSPDMIEEVDQELDKVMEHAKRDAPEEFRILDRKQLSEDEMVVTSYMNSSNDPNGHAEDTVFQKIGGEWKVTKKQAPQD